MDIDVFEDIRVDNINFCCFLGISGITEATFYKHYRPTKNINIHIGVARGGAQEARAPPPQLKYHQ